MSACSRLTRWALVLCGATTIPASALAQTSPAAPTNPEMVITLSPFAVTTKTDKGYLASNSVSGSRLNTAIKDLPFALQAFTEDFINDQKPMNIFDIAIYSPGVTYRSNDFNEGNANIAIRGFAVGSAGNTMVLRDGFRGPPIFDFTNVVRMEIVKGPASFLYGQLAPGGMVNVITKSPKDKFEGTLAASYGSYNGHRVALDLTGPVAAGLSYRLAASYTHDMEYWQPYESNQTVMAPQILWKLNEQAVLAVKFESFRKKESPQVMQKPGWGYASGLLPSATDPNLSGVDVPGLPDDWNSMADTDFRDSRDVSLATTLDVKAGEHWDVRLGFAHDKNTVDQTFSGNLGMTNNTYFQGRRWRWGVYENTTDIIEGQLTGKYELGPVTLRLLGGAQYNPYEFYQAFGQMANSSTPSYSPASPLPPWDLRVPATWNRTIPASFTRTAATANATRALTRSKDTAFYAGVTAGFFQDRLTALAGLRRTSTSSQTNNLLTNVVGPEFVTKRNTPQIGAMFKLTRAVSVFASYSESFVPNARVLQGVDKSSANWSQYVIGPAAPTLGQGYDIGFKTDLREGRISGTVTYFNVEQSNIINDISEFNAATGSQFFTNIQSGLQRSRGVEADLTLSPTDNWQVYASASFMDAEIVYLYSEATDAFYLAANPATLDAAQQANFKNVHRYHGKPLQMSAPRQYNLWTRYNFRGDLAGLFVGGGVNHIRDQTLLPDTPDWAHQTYTLWNALIGFSTKIQGHPTTIELSGKNLADEYYRPSQSSRARPREWMLTVSSKF